MLPIEELRSLEVGDAIEAGTLMAGLTQEPLRLTVTAIERDPLVLTITGTYFGVHIGHWEVTAPDGKPVWTWLDSPIQLIGSEIAA